VTVAFLLISTYLGAEEEVFLAVEEISEVTEAYKVYGIYDIIARIEAETPQEIKETAAQIRHLENVRSTMTLMCMDPSKRGSE